MSLPSGTRPVSRVASSWASWGLVEAALQGIREILACGTPAAHIVIMSGQCYPLWPVERALEFFSNHRNESFVASWAMPSQRVYGEANGGMYRLKYWHRPIGRRRFWIPIPRKYPKGLMPFGGAQFMVLARHHAQSLLSFTAANPAVVRFHRHVWIPDEHYFPTVLRNLHDDEIINENLWHAEWDLGAKHPKLYTLNDFDGLAEAARNSSTAGGASRAKLFARKFDLSEQPLLLDRIEQELLQT